MDSTSVRSFLAICSWIFCNKWSIWPALGCTVTFGSTSPVGRMTCSTTSPPLACSS